MTQPLLSIRNVAKQYGQHTALAGVSFDVAAGELFGLLGPNGAGKTTLLSIVSCLLEASAGEALIMGQKASTHDRNLRRSIGIVPQELAIYGELNARENLSFFGSLYGVAGEELRKRVDRTLEAIGLTDRANDRVENFSGGMKRRLNLGAALIHQPKLLLLGRTHHGRRPAVAQSHLRGSAAAGGRGRRHRLHQPLHRGSAVALLAGGHHRSRQADRLRRAAGAAATDGRGDSLSRAGRNARACASHCDRFPACRSTATTGPAWKWNAAT